jgi:hypothetical protein
MIILALDALDNNMVEKFNCKNLMQLEFGKTNISDFELERTVVLWASFLTGKNLEKDIPIKGQWDFKLTKNETLFNFFNSHKVIDVPAFTLKNNHEKERKLLKNFFEGKSTIKDYDEIVWKIHEENKKEFFDCLGKFECLMVYFNLADAIGHLSFGDINKMKKVYGELDNITNEIKSTNELILIVSDHGMKSVGKFGDHTRYGYYSINKKMNLDNPKITDFYKIIKDIT